MKKSIISCVVVISLVMGGLRLTCSIIGRWPDPRKDWPRFYWGPITTSELSGTWVIEPDCLPTLVNVLGYRQFTNQLDHIIVLNTDGTSVYRGFDDYEIPSMRSRANEAQLHDGRIYEGSVQYPNGVNGALPWLYDWNPAGDPIIRGPFKMTNAMHTLEGVVQSTRWPLWSIVDSKSDRESTEENGFGDVYRYEIRLEYIGTIGHTDYIDRWNCLFLGKDNHGFFLWKPIFDVTNQSTIFNDQIISFRKK